MNQIAQRPELRDAHERELAAVTFERNVVVTAGAGTGKTTLLVDRLVHLLLRDPDPLAITEIVALTFTNKAADEMKLRLRERLQSYLAVRLDREAASPAEIDTKKNVAALLARYRLTKDESDRRIHDALRRLERSDIGTVHSFAATLLRLYPLEAGVDPQFREDDGKQFERLFDEQWNLWLDLELSSATGRAAVWRAVLGKVSLEQTRALAQSLCSETVDLRRETQPPGAIPAAVRSWLSVLEAKAGKLIESHPENRTNEKLVRAAQLVIQTWLHGGANNSTTGEASSLVIEKSLSRDLKGWSDEELEQAQELVRTAKGLCQIDTELTAALWQLLAPFAEKFREFFVREGLISFDGLLIRARNLVRDHARVRNELKRHYRAILIDEFQDTDPIQYEILLYLAERQGQSARDWRKVRLESGKIFVVGDPKQSIYAFRRADIEAYLEVVDRIIKAQDGMECRLATNFRSNGGILAAVNGVFTSLIRPQDGVQPPYIAIYPAPGRPPALDKRLPEIMVRKVIAGEEVDAEKARRLEGESLARWLHDEVLGRTVIRNPSGESFPAQAKDVAILFRKLTDIHDYLEPFRRSAIRYVVEGERHFYATKEVIDAVNLFRAVENPHDRLALVGVLRSPLGGLTDRQIYDLHRTDALDYRKTARLDSGNEPPALLELYRTLARLHRETRLVPVGEAIGKIFAALPLKLLAACHFHGEQAVANLEKLRQQAILLGHEGSITLKEAIRQLQRRVLDVKEEGESVLAEENLDAVRIMSIHKAKGLEFPIVVLAGCQSGSDGRASRDADALFDWSTELSGIRVGRLSDLTGLFVAEKARRNAVEEQKRVLYVAITRAREHLVLSCAPTSRRMSGSFLSMLDESLAESVEAAACSRTIRAGKGIIHVEVISQDLTAPGVSAGGKLESPRRDWQPFVDVWARRRDRYEAGFGKPRFVTPTLLDQRAQEPTEAAPGAPGPSARRSTALRIGDLAHAFLESWDFAADPRSFRDRLNVFTGQPLAEETAQDRALIAAELENIFRCFFRSSVYRELAGARILGREVPLLMPWNGQVMEGIIDLIYERSGLIYLADYKTDKIAPGKMIAAAARYQRQAEIYSTAVSRSLGQPPAAFKIIFLRLGGAVEIVMEKNSQGMLF